MNIIEYAVRYSGIGILRKAFFKLPKYSCKLLSFKIFYLNNRNDWRYFHKSVYCAMSESQEYDVFNHLKLKRRNTEAPEFKTFLPSSETAGLKTEEIPYIKLIHGQHKKVYMDVYGCQMNVSDAEVILSILKNSGYTFTKELNDADVILLLTCAIRQGAEEKIWRKLNYFRHLMNKRKILGITTHVKIGLLGCMAERLKEKIIERDRLVDIIAGPDSYKDLPRLLAITDDNETAINVVLSFDETYADITPIRLNPEAVTAFVTIMRGCDNMCTYCIVPFTRGREKSRPISSIENEIRSLSDQGVKEVVLLGQNVNSYRDDSVNCSMKDCETKLAKGFKTVYRNKKGGLRFSDLLDRISLINPEMRVRFTSPHPKDFPDDVLQLIAERPNICKQLHLPAQSGNSAVLERMRRGYTREAYLELVDHVRSIIPNVFLSSDFIAGFCGESDSEFEDTISLMQMVKYNQAYLFAYSMREKTAAHRHFKDDIEEHVKMGRLQQMINIYRNEAKKLNEAQIGQQQLVLIEGLSRKNSQYLVGRNDGNIKVIISNCLVQENISSNFSRRAVAGDYVVVQISNANFQTLRGIPLYFSSVSEFTSSTK